MQQKPTDSPIAQGFAFRVILANVLNDDNLGRAVSDDLLQHDRVMFSAVIALIGKAAAMLMVEDAGLDETIEQLRKMIASCELEAAAGESSGENVGGSL